MTLCSVMKGTIGYMVRKGRRYNSRAAPATISDVWEELGDDFLDGRSGESTHLMEGTDEVKGDDVLGQLNLETEGTGPG